jgi:hypothetical protein
MREGLHPTARRSALAAVALAVLPMLMLAGPVHSVEGGLLVTADARYVALPGEARVHVTVDAVATSQEPDTADARVYYSGLTMAMPAEATNIGAYSGGVALAVRVVEEGDGYRAVEVAFSRRLFYRQSYAYTVSFDLVDAGGVPDRDVRVGRSLVAFPVWAFGTEGEPGGSVRVELPSAYRATVQGSGMTEDRLGSVTVLTASPDDPFAFFAYVSADRPNAFAETPIRVPMDAGSARLTIRAWDDDPAWETRTTRLLRDGLPMLEELIGVPYPHAGTLKVEEAAISRLGEYAGIYDPTTAVISVRYDADAFVTLHEAAHLWFNDRLLSGRWIGEAWAELYSIEAGEAIGEEGYRWELTEQLRRARVPLNDWGAVGREDLAVEDFAYAASYEVATRVVERTSLEALRRVWQAASDREPSYLPTDGSADGRRAPLGQPGWQRLLDLLEERTGGSYADLWARWIVNDEQEPLLAARASVRFEYADVLQQADDWQLPAVIREDLALWAFDDARTGLQQADRVLDDRDRIAQLAARLDLQVSDRLRRAFEGDDGLDAARSVARAELAALAELESASDHLADEPSALEAIGLLGANPDRLLDAARTSYESGALGEAQRAATAAEEARGSAGAEGRSRVVVVAATLLALDGLALSSLSAARLRRRGRVAAP